MRKTIERVAQEADAVGMTYGQYVALTEFASDKDREIALPGWKPGWKPDALPVTKGRKKRAQRKGFCARCGGEMVRTNNRQLYCAACQEEKNREYSREYQRKNAAERMRQAEERRKLRERYLICPICKEGFRTTDRKRVYCSMGCGHAAQLLQRRKYDRKRRKKEDQDDDTLR